MAAYSHVYASGGKQSSNQPDEKRIQWEMDLLREFDEKRLVELQRKIAQARKAFHANNKQSPRS